MLRLARYIIIIILLPLCISAATVTVTNLTDVVNGDVSSVASLISNNGGDGISYREAILATNNTNEPNIINVGVSGTVTLLSNMDNIQSENIIINGNGIILDGDGTYFFGRARTRIATLNDLVFINGGSNNTIFAYIGSGSNLGELFIMNNCTFDSNNSGNFQVFECDDPGCILNNCVIKNNIGRYGVAMCEDEIYFNNCIFENNSNSFFTYYHESGIGEFRGCLFVGNTADSSIVFQKSRDSFLLFINTTFSDNTLSGPGDAIFDFDSGDRDHLELINVTIENNNVSGGAAVFKVEEVDSLVIKNTIISNSGAPADYFNDETNGFIISISNIFAGYTGIVPYKSNQDPMLGSLQDNGGPTMTHALLPGSPAIDMANAGECPSVDQRDFIRDANCDIGAFEFGANPLVVPTLSQWGIIILSLIMLLFGTVAFRRYTLAG